MTDRDSLEVLEGPVLDEAGNVRFSVRVHGSTFPVFIVPSRAVGGVPRDVPAEATNIAMRFAARFSSSNRVLVHRLLRRGQTELGSPGERLPEARIVSSPESTGDGMLRFKGFLGDDTFSLTMGADLRPPKVRFASGREATEAEFFAAYDAALEFMLNDVDAIEQLGFDVSLLRAG